MKHQPRTSFTRNANALRMAISIALAVDCMGFVHSVYADDTCYRDENGRITARRRPGSVEVPCPGAAETTPSTTAPSTQRRLPGSPDSSNGTVDTRRQNPSGLQRTERAPPASISPIPRPGANDYVESVLGNFLPIKSPLRPGQRENQAAHRRHQAQGPDPLARG